MLTPLTLNKHIKVIEDLYEAFMGALRINDMLQLWSDMYVRP